MKHISFTAMLVLASVGVQAAPYVYIPLGSGNQVVKIDAQSDKVIAQYANVENSHGLVATPDGEFLYAGSFIEKPGSSKGLDGNLFMIHPAHGHVMETVPVTGMSHHQAITPDGKFVLSTHPGKGLVSVIDVETNRQVATPQTGPSPYYVLVNGDGSRAFVSNRGDGTVTEFEVGSWRQVRKLEAGASPSHLAISKDGSHLYVVNSRSGTLTVLELATGSVVNVVSLGRGLHGLDISEDGEWLFVSAQADEKLFAVSTKDYSLKEIGLSPKPYHLNTITGTGKVYVSSSSQPLMWVIDQASFTLQGRFDLPAGEGHQMAITSE